MDDKIIGSRVKMANRRRAKGKEAMSMLLAGQTSPLKILAKYSRRASRKRDARQSRMPSAGHRSSARRHNSPERHNSLLSEINNL